VRQRLTDWGIHRIYGYPGDGINAFLGAFDRAEGDPEFIQVRHEEMAAFMACGHAKFTGEVGACIATSGPGAIHLLNGLYDAKLDHQPVVAIVGQQKRISQGAHYQQEVALDRLFADVSEFCQLIMHPAQARHVIDRAFKTALTFRSVATIIIPDDIQEEDAVPSPPKMHGAVYSSVGWTRPRVLPDEAELAKAADILNEGSGSGVESNIDGSLIGMRYPMDAHLVGDSRETLKQLIPLLRRKEDRSWREQIEKNVRTWNRIMVDRAGQSFGGLVNPQAVAAELSSRL